MDTAKTSNDLSDLTFWPGNSVWLIVTSWVVFMPYIKQIGQIGTERNMTLTFWPGSGVWCIIPPWVLFVPHMKWIGQIAMEQTSQKLPTTQQLWPSAFWPRNGPYDLFLGHISISQIGRETQSGYGQNFQRAVWLAPLTLWNGYGVWHIMTSWVVFVPHIDGLVQERRNSSA